MYDLVGWMLKSGDINFVSYSFQYNLHFQFSYIQPYFLIRIASIENKSFVPFNRIISDIIFFN